MLLEKIADLKEEIRYDIAEKVYEATDSEEVADFASKVVVPIGISDIAMFIKWAMNQ